ncbi:MAG: DUF4234 domain-containing protein [Ilumatobacter sp.]|uniref:DUF4234 domain-containing protein n=1 Tax=Ilumatobacter sp. TaxID=1967498 RepID=UPI00391A28FF
MTDMPPPPMTPPPPPASAMGGVQQGPVGKRRSIGLVILLSIVTFGIWIIVWSYQNGDEIKRFSGNGIGGIGYLFITLLLSPITMFLLAGEVEQMYRKEGKEPPITTIWGLWFLLPVIGNIIWYVRIQNAINDHWTAHGQTNKPSL